MSVWRERARRHIEKLVQDLPADATLEQRRKALRGKGWPAHGNTRWGRKMWGKEVRAYLAKFGETARDQKTGFDWPAHIHFPFREGRNG